jgi:hypothetical protein
MTLNPRSEASGCFWLITGSRRRILHLPPSNVSTLVRSTGRSRSPDFRGSRNVLPQLRKENQRLKHPGQRNNSYLSGKNYLVTVDLRMMSALNGIGQESSATVDRLPAMNAPFCDDMQYGGWNKLQSANEDEVRFSNLTSMCLADDDLVGIQLSPGTPSSLPRDKVVHQADTTRSSSRMYQADTTRSSSRHSGTSRMTSPRRRRSSHHPHSSTMGSFNLQRL